MTINTEFIANLRPNKDLLDNYLTHYSDFSGSLGDFLNLDKISDEDKIWVFTKDIKEFKRAQQLFTLICASKVVEKTNYDPLKEYFTLVIFIVQNEFWDLKDTDEYKEAFHAALFQVMVPKNAVQTVLERLVCLETYWELYWELHWAASGIAEGASFWAAHTLSDNSYDFAAEKHVQIEVIKSLI